MIEVGLAEKPVYRDGLTTSLSYAFLAVKKHEDHNGVVYSFGMNKLKFYPNAQFWGVTAAVLNECGIPSHRLYSRQDYQGVPHVGKAEVAKLLEVLRGQRGTVAVPDAVIKAYNAQADQPRDRCRALYPSTSRVPSSYPAYAGARA